LNQTNQTLFWYSNQYAGLQQYKTKSSPFLKTSTVLLQFTLADWQDNKIK